MMEFYRENQVKVSRKPHRCHICECEIPAGSSYLRESGMYDGEFFDRCTCFPCDKARDDYLYFYEVQEYDTEGVNFLAQEAICYDCPEIENCRITMTLSCPKVKDHYASKEG